MPRSEFGKASLFALALVVIFIFSWEFFLRQKGLKPSFDDGSALWADKRAKIYEPRNQSMVFIGSSRIKYDLDLDTWKQTTGITPIQLAIEGTSPMPVLDDLANDSSFRGDLVIDITEFLFFSTSEKNTSEPIKRVGYYKKRTPAQRASFQINHVAESGFVFLDEENYSTNALLDKIKIPNRNGVFTLPIFPIDFGRVSFERQNKMTDRFLSDTNLQNQVKGIWVFYGKATTEPPISGKKLDSIMNNVKGSVAKIQSRGGRVIFVRTPSSSPMFDMELQGYPREKYWDRLLAETGCDGIYFKDYPELSGFVCPEWSHLAPHDAISFTHALIRIMEKKRWLAAPRNIAAL
jgi:hypothetical protein